ncbi:MAG: RNA polymerase sigma-70 factor [Tannerella sp.]|jgi:RNA polymerase sigma-70 factor (ECF subfamily)|nr:RNA polymerase sigma-70 factor [Tannerella sp.]
MDTANKLQLFNRLYADYQKRFVRFACTYVRDLAVAEDITADAFVHYWEHIDSLAPDISAPAYILGIIRNKSLTYLQREQVREVVEEKLRNHAEWELRTRVEMLEACNPEALFTAEIQAIVDRTLALLPEQTRRIFMMSRYRNMSHKEIAAQSDMTVKGVEFHISKALKLLKVNLKDYLFAFLYLFL